MAMRYFRQRGNTDSILIRAISDTAEGPEAGYDEGRFPAARVALVHSTETPNFPDHSGDNPKELFTHRPAQIVGAYADKKARATVPHMVAMALHQSGTSGVNIMADSSLTQYSSHLAQRAGERGLVSGDPTNPDMESNTSELRSYEKMPRITDAPLARFVITTDAENGHPDRQYDEIGRHERAAAKDLLRRRIGRNTEPVAKRGDNQFHQLKLDI